MNVLVVNTHTSHLYDYPHLHRVGYPDPSAFCNNVGYVLAEEICFIFRKHEVRSKRVYGSFTITEVMEAHFFPQDNTGRDSKHVQLIGSYL